MRLKLVFKRPSNINDNIQNPLFADLIANFACIRIESIVARKISKDLN